MIQRAVTAALGVSPRSVHPLRGGDVARSFRVELEDDRTVFAKTKPDATAEFFDTEARGLRWLREADALPVPEVLAVGFDPPLLVLAWIDEARTRPASDASFGRALAGLHQHHPETFGRADRRPTGSRSLPNEPASSWGQFYAECRLLPLARMAADSAALDAYTIAGLEQVAGRLDQFEGADEAPARLHGDLWAGNRIVDSAGVSWMIDPAAHGGHREFDLAMMALFGGWADDVFSAYNEVFPLASGWRERVALHQLAPLAVHAIKFGGGYAAATRDAVTRYL